MPDLTRSPLLEEDAEDLYEHAPCGYLSTLPDGTIVKANGTFVTWTAHDRDALLGKRFPDPLTAGGQIYHEMHVAPLLRMQTVVHYVVAGVALVAERKPELSVQVSVDEGIPAPLIGDPDRLAQIFSNLLTNAVKFTERGLVSLAVLLRELGPQAVTVEVASATRASVFRPIGSVPSSTSTRRRAARLVRDTGGAVWVSPSRASCSCCTAPICA